MGPIGAQQGFQKAPKPPNLDDFLETLDSLQHTHISYNTPKIPQNTPKIRANGLTRMMSYTHSMVYGHFNVTFYDSLNMFKTIYGDFDFFSPYLTHTPSLHLSPSLSGMYWLLNLGKC